MKVEKIINKLTSDLSLHYFRNILVSVLGEIGAADVILSVLQEHTVDTSDRTENYTNVSIVVNLPINNTLNFKEV